MEPSLPEQLRHKIAGALQETVPVPVDQVLPQLHLGGVALTIRQLRACAPELLASLNGHDDIAISLPLSEIVPQLDKNCFTRREPLKRWQVPDDVTSIFTPTSDGAAIALNAHLASPPPKPAAPAQPATKTAAAPAKPQPTQAAKPAAAPAPKVAAPVAATPKSAPAPAPAPIAMPAAATAAAAAPIAAPAAEPERKISLSSDALASLATARPATPAPAASAAIKAAPVSAASPAIARPAVSSAPAAQMQAPWTAPAAPSAPVSAPAAPRPVFPSQPASATPSTPMPLPLPKVFATLPQEVREELGDVDVNASTLNLPMPLVEAGLKSGRVLFAWNDLANMLQPPLPRPPSRSAGEILVELPLKIIAPAFMAHHRAGGAQKVADVGENIPDLFQGGTTGAPTLQTSATVPRPQAATPAPAPAPAQPATAAPSPASKPAVAAVAQPRPAVVLDAPKPAASQLPSLDEITGPAGQRYSPKQILQNVGRLTGVSGSLVALTDGLLVASALPAAAKSDTVAAFLPQMFGRMSQYTKELGLGALQNMNLNVEGGCWHVFKQPNIYFAVCGKTGETMPLNLLTQIAAELSKQTV